MACMKYCCNICLKGQRKANENMSCQLVPWTRFTPGITIWTNPSVDLYNISHHCYQNKCCIHIPVYLSMSLPWQLPQFTAGAYTACQQVPSHAQPIYLQSPSPSKVHLCWCKCSVTSQMMGLNIAVKTQCNDTPNSSLQYTQVPLQYWAVFVMPSGYNLNISPLSNTFPTEYDFWEQL